MSGIEELNMLAKRLAALTDDPRPGLYSWTKMVADVSLEIADFCGRQEVVDAVKLVREREKK